MPHLLRHGRIVLGLCSVAALAALPAGAFASVAHTASILRGFAVTVSPASVNGGTTTAMTATIKNEGLLIPIQSAELFVPAGLNVTAATLPTGSRAKLLLTTCTHGTVTSQCVQLTNMNLLPGRSMAISMSVAAAPGCAASTLTWGAAARPDSLIALLLQLLGLGNLPLDTANSHLATTVNDSCSVSFTQEPNNVTVGQPITGASYASGPPVVVTVTDAANAPVAGVQVTAALANNPSSATLGGTTSQTTNSSGAATFADLTVDQPGLGYTLRATASTSGSPSATSTPFDAQNAAATCNGSCSTTAGNAAGSAQIAATGPNGTTGTLTESVNVPSEPGLTCAGYTSADPNTYDFVTTNTALSKVVTITITQPQGTPAFDPFDNDSAPDGDNDYDDVLANQQICFQAPYPFEATDVMGNSVPATPSVVGGQTVYTGLLPDCNLNNPGPGPCHNRAGDSIPPASTPLGYYLVLQAKIPANLPGDPRMN